MWLDSSYASCCYDNVYTDNGNDLLTNTEKLRTKTVIKYFSGVLEAYASELNSIIDIIIVRVWKVNSSQCERIYKELEPYSYLFMTC